ncbi:MAG: 4Fe-4S dicluster domain-containing protein [Deltaproteobacteria bacterium]|nr:4Fe-4S dicluster domain-containing protein [Deltaproteobacteria bacterium]
MERYEIEIYRFDPSIGGKESCQTHIFEFEYRPTILEILRKIRHGKDASLSFRESCGLGKCGSCAVIKNGSPVLACQTRLDPGKTTIAPLSNHAIIKDLVIDRSTYHDRMKQMRVFHAQPDYVKREQEPINWSTTYQRLNQCIGCLICESVCPAFEHSESEFPGPALLVQLSRTMNHPLAMGMEEHVAWIDGIHNCTACMKCTKACPKDIDPFRNAVISLRTAISDKALLLPRMQEGLSEQFIKSGRLVPLKHAEWKHENIDPGSTTALFLGCMMSERYPDEGKLILDLLSAMGMQVSIPPQMVCCGGPLMWVGKTEDAIEAFNRNLNILTASGVKEVITPCTGCSLTLKEDYFSFYRQKTGKNLSFEVVDITEYLAEKLDRLDVTTGPLVRVVFHMPCHHGRGQELIERRLSERTAAGIEIIGRTDKCCGGMTASSNPQLALELSVEIIEEAETTGADILATACIFCRDNLLRATRRRRSRIRVENISFLIAKQLRKMRP